MEALALYTGAPTVNGEGTPVVFLLLKLKELLLELNILILQSVFYKNNLTMVSFFQNMKIYDLTTDMKTRYHISFEMLSSNLRLDLRDLNELMYCDLKTQYKEYLVPWLATTEISKNTATRPGFKGATEYSCRGE